MLRFAEEITLLLLDSDGRFANVPDWSVSHALAGGVLMDLALEGRIDTDLDHLFLLDSTPVGDSLLDPTLAEIKETARLTEPHSAQFWVQQAASRGRRSSFGGPSQAGCLGHSGTARGEDSVLLQVYALSIGRRYGSA